MLYYDNYTAEDLSEEEIRQRNKLTVLMAMAMYRCFTR